MANDMKSASVCTSSSGASLPKRSRISTILDPAQRELPSRAVRVSKTFLFESPESAEIRVAKYGAYGRGDEGVFESIDTRCFESIDSCIAFKCLNLRPSITTPTKLVYYFSYKKKTAPEVLAQLRKSNPKMSDAEVSENFGYADGEAYIEARFASGKLNYLAISKSETY